MAVLELGRLLLREATSSFTVELEGATFSYSSVFDCYFNEVRDPEGRIIAFSSPIA